MRTRFGKTALLVLFSLSTFTFMNAAVPEVTNSTLRAEIGRWRDSTVADLTLVQPLVDDIYESSILWDSGNQEALSRWAEIRGRLERALRDKPESPFAADVKLAVASLDVVTGRARSEARTLLESIASEHGNSPVMAGCLQPWTPLVKQCYRRRGNNLSAVPQDKVVERVLADPSLRSQFLCMEHLRAFPVLASEIALLRLAEIHMQEGNTDKAIQTLRRLLSSRSDIAGVVAEDKKNSSDPSRHFIYALRRPNLHAVLYLMQIYTRQGKVDDALAVGESVVQKISADGYYWEFINLPLADVYTDQGRKGDAAREYRRSLDGYLAGVDNTCRYLKSVTRSLSWDRVQQRRMWETDILNIKKHLAACGEQVDLDIKELLKVREKYFLRIDGGSSSQRSAETPSTQAEEQRTAPTVRETATLLGHLEELKKKEGALSTPAGRRTAVHEVFEVLVLQGIADTDEAKELLRKQRTLVAVGLAHLAGEEPDIETRRFMLGKMGEICGVAPADKSDRSVSQTERQKVDRLIKQMSGETGIEGAVPEPQSELSDMSVPALLYAAERVEQGAFPLQTRQTITKALANSENPALFKFFGDIVQRAEDEKLTRFAVRGLERILENTPGGDQAR